MSKFPRRTLLEAAIVAPLGAAVLQACDDGGVLDAPDAAARSDADAGTAVDADAGAGVDAGNADAGVVDGGVSCAPTPRDAEGPFFRPGAPARMDLVDANEPGERLRVTGRVTEESCQPIAGALLDVWQADADGNYDNDDVAYRLRGQVMTDADGAFEVRSIRPGPYLDGGGFRPAHLHFTVTAPGHVALTTQLYFAGDPYLSPNDSCASCNSDEPALIIDLVDPLDGTFRWQGHFDVVLR